ncbi:MAG: hypothetical protein WKF61_00870 [Luteimonas sp.]
MEWKRQFMLTRMLHPTRSSVISLDAEHVRINRGWNFPTRLHKDAKACVDNRRLFEALVRKWSQTYSVIDAATHDAFKDRRTDSPRNLLIEGVPLREVLNEFMLNLRVTDYNDSSLHTALTLALGAAVKDDELCDVFLIGELTPQTRSLTSTERINTLFVGKSPNVDDFDRLTYVGDSALHGNDRVAVHLRKYDLRQSKLGPTIARDVPWYAIHLPQRLAKDSVIEEEKSGI